MQKKKILAVLLAILTFALSFVGCSGSTEAKNSFRENYGDDESRKNLSICIDMGKYSSQYDGTGYETDTFNRFISDIKSATGMKEVSILFLPGEGAERESLLDSLRVEIMAGGGPDVFLLKSVGNTLGYTDVLVRFPEKSMQNGLFLPLDKYMENNTRYTDWSRQTKAILDAGRSKEGQVIIPLTYTLPVLVYPKADVKLKPSAELTMQDILNDQNTAELGSVLYDGVRPNGVGRIDENGWSLHENLLASMLGKLADFEKEELLFTEEELMEMLDTVSALRKRSEKNQQCYFEENLGIYLCHLFNMADFDEEMVIVPLYSRDGGVSASITSYAAVNRNTAYPEEAFTVIDFLMQEKAQQENDLYSIFFMPFDGIPLQDDLFQEEKPLQYADPVCYLKKPYYDDLCSIKKQITNVSFRNEINVVLESLMFDWALEYLESGTYDKDAASEAYEKMKRMIGE